MPESNGCPLGCDLLVFDLDGTLIDSQRDLAASVNATLASSGRKPLDLPVIAGFIGDGASMLLQRALDATGGSDEHTLSSALRFFLGYYAAHSLDDTRCYPGVVPALEQLRGLSPDLPMAVLTNKPVGASRTICEALGLSRFFFAVYGGNSFATKKPHPEGMHVLLSEASARAQRTLHPRRTVLVGDSHVDVETARNAGAKSIGCLYGLSPDTLRKSAPDRLISHPSQWADAVRDVLSGT